jgi:hypothetical protein
MCIKSEWHLTLALAGGSDARRGAVHDHRSGDLGRTPARASGGVNVFTDFHTSSRVVFPHPETGRNTRIECDFAADVLQVPQKSPLFPEDVIRVSNLCLGSLPKMPSLGSDLRC